MPDEEFRDVANELARLGAKKMHRWPEWEDKFLTMMRMNFGADDQELYGPVGSPDSDAEWSQADMDDERAVTGSKGTRNSAASNARAPGGWKKRGGRATEHDDADL